MTRRLELTSLLLAVLFLIVSQSDLSGYEVKLVERLEFAHSQEATLFPRDICITEDGLLLISDQHTGDVKIYSREGETLRLIGTIGGRETDNEEIQYPTYCFYNPNESKFGVIDFAKKKILLYDRVSKVDFKYIQTIDCPYLSDGILLIDSKLLISGFTLDSRNNSYDLYSIDLTSNQTTFLLPSYLKYGLKSPAEYKDKYHNSLAIKALGINGLFALRGDYIYFAWEGDLKIIKMDMETGREVPFKRADRKGSPYVRPSTSNYFPALLRGYEAKDTDIIRRAKTKMSLVRHIFTDAEHIYVVYEGPIVKKSGKESNFHLQIYSINGEFLADVPIPGQPDRPMYFDADQCLLYSLGKYPGTSEYSILKYLIHK
ncbi:MAG: hypothetical protein KAT34_16255 [Candidatus Aminicenantes bacterium]|nr:hypothetical protein [Candidatus Aminicenantes bacterium]